ncbi:hypothetical protein GJ496_004297 [Pomphorhynchus laevis]|nr:hypothetical protein GJ496_005981 [Pomphorhynchus laevis]KAI0982441.1 hypothetical protein GJ496_004297 [Pomphorhynchus laevis]
MMTCNVGDSDEEKDSFQRILCGIFADTSEDSEGVLFFIESSVFNSTITIRSNLHSYTIPTTDIQLNFGPVAPAEID